MQYNDEIERILNGRNTFFDDVVSRLSESVGITETQAEAEIRAVCNIEHNGEVAIVTGIDNQVLEIHRLDMESGKPTGTFWELTEMPVLEDVGHPLVPNLNHNYYPREIRGMLDYELFAISIMNERSATLAVGQTGTGKNVMFKYMFSGTNWPMIRVNFGINTTYEKLIGLYTPSEDGGFEWRDGMLTKAVRHGWAFVADEINAAPPEVTVELNGLAEEKGSAMLTIPEKNEVVIPHDNFRLCATMNPPMYAGVRPMNKAFQDRFDCIDFPYLPEREEIKVVMEKSNIPENGEAVARNLVKMAARLRSQGNAMDGATITTPVSTRKLLQICDFAYDKDGNSRMGVKDAANIILGGYAEPGDKAMISTVIDRTL